MGWLSALSRHKILILKFWNLLCKLPSTRLTKRVFDWDCQSTNIKGTWTYAVRQILNGIKCPELISNLNCCNIDYATSIIYHDDCENWQNKRYKSEKLRYYNLYKSEKNVEEYLLFDITKYQRSVFAQFRCGILPLQIEIGRFRNIDLPDRVCQICDAEVEDEIHLLLACVAYAEPRERLLKKAVESNNFFPNYDVFEKFTFLMSNLQNLSLNSSQVQSLLEPTC